MTLKIPFRLTLAITLFVVLTLTFTYPVWTRPDTLLNDPFDARLNTWILAWDAHALADTAAALFDANIFYPYSHTLAFSENLLGAALPVAPLNWTGHPILAYNMVLLGSFVLSGVAMLLWVRRMSGSWTAGLVAGVAWAYAPSKTDHLAHLQLLTSGWVPAALWLLTIYVEERRRGLLTAAAALLGWQYWNGIQATLVMAPLVGLFFVHAWRQRPRPREGDIRRLGTEAAVAGLLFLLLVLPLSIPYLEVSDAQGMSRSLEETRLYSARPQGFVAGSWTNRTAHMMALHRLAGAPEGNHGVGILGSLLLAAAVASGMAFVTRRLRRRDDPRARRFSHGLRLILAGAALLTAGATLLHLTGVLVAIIDPAGPLAWMIDVSQTAHPALWMAGGSTVLALAWPRDDPENRSHVTVVGLLWLTGLAYLLALGPEVRVQGIELGTGPFRFLYEWILPYRSIRSVGRFGLAWLLFATPLIGLAASRLRDVFGEGGRRAGVAAALAGVVILVMAWEYRTWPLATHDMSVAEPDLYRTLATLPDQGAILHLPFHPLGDPPRPTEYMLGSTLHWRPLVNGYSGFAPADTDRLARRSPASDAFWQVLHSDFPVDHVVVHGRWLQRAEREDLLETLRARPELRPIRQVGDSTIFSVTRVIQRGSLVRRRFAARQLQRAGTVAFDVRSLGAASDPVVSDLGVEVLWGDAVAGKCPVARIWTRCRVPAPPGWAPRDDGTASIEVWTPPADEHRVELGATGALLSADLLVDAQLHRLGVARDDRWDRMRDAAGAVIAVMNLGGRGIRRIREFPATEEGAEALRHFVSEVPEGRILAIAAHVVEPSGPGDDSASHVAAALRLAGARGELPDGTWVHAVLGARGAPRGTALEHHSPSWAAVRAGPDSYPGNRIAVRDLETQR